MDLFMHELFQVLFGGILQNEDNATSLMEKSDNEELTEDFTKRMLELDFNKTQSIEFLQAYITNKELEENGLLLTPKTAFLKARILFNRYVEAGFIDSENLIRKDILEELAKI